MLAQSFCSTTQRNCQRLIRWWPDALSSTNPAYANVMQVILFQVLRWVNVGSTLVKGTNNLEFVRKVWFSYYYLL